MGSAFGRFVGGLDYPVFVVTAAAPDGERAGCLIGFATQCSIDPPRFLACLSMKNRTFEVARQAECLAVHALAEDDRDAAELFGGETGDEVDKFARVRWHSGPGGAPVLDGADAWFAGRVLDVIDLGDHAGFVLEPVDAEADGGADGEKLLTFQDAKDIDAGPPACAGCPPSGSHWLARKLQ
jgi:flavin reductase (DIM6/NTAB) family NADH-FMN oxidoreductase RutF